MASYTEKMEDKLYAQWALLDEDDGYNESTIIEFINGEEFSRSFGEALIDIINRNGGNISAETAIPYIKARCVENNVPLSEIASINTLKSWFNQGPPPKKGDAGRKSMFALAFACSFGIDATVELFHKAYMDRAFDYRNHEELICYYSISKGYKMDRAMELEGMVGRIEDCTEDKTEYTVSIRDFAGQAVSDQDLIEYITSHPHSFKKKNETAKRSISLVIEEARKLALKEIKENMELEKSLGREDSEYKGIWMKNGESISNNVLFRIITGISPSSDRGTVTVLKKARLPKEIRNRFPEAQSLGIENSTYEELRKTMILVLFYRFWRKAEKLADRPGIDDYSAETDKYLEEAGFSYLYPGNPYDWLFLYCSLNDDPLATLKDILAGALEE